MQKQEHRIRIDPVLVNKFQRLPGGTNEVGTKIVRDFGLQYAYDKQSQNLDIIGPHPEILSLAIETLRFWVEEDDYPNTGITCQVGYPNKCMVIWRYHGDYAKKLDHLFTEDIAKLKQIPTVNVKAVPSKRNPEYVEIYCHFTFYDRVKDEITRLSSELSRINQDDFFVPYSDYMKAKRFARSKANDDSALFALKEYPERNRVRVWIFAREQVDVIRAKKDWIQHVGNIANDAQFKETVIKDGGVNSAHFYGPSSASTSRESFSPHLHGQDNGTLHPNVRQHGSHQLTIQQNSPRTKQPNLATSKHLKGSKSSVSGAKSDTSSIKEIRIPATDNYNFTRPSNFIYPIGWQTVTEPMSCENVAHQPTNPFNSNELNDIQEEKPTKSPDNSSITQSKWEKGTGAKYPSKHRTGKMAPNRIYVHYQVNEHKIADNQQEQVAVKQVVHPETNLVAKERYKTRKSERILTSVTDPKLAPAVKRNKKVRPGVKHQLQPKAMAFKRQRPVLEANKADNVRYHINVNGLDIYMYKHNITKLHDMEAIVNVVNSDVKPGGHLAANILDMAGPQVADEIKVYLNITGPLRVAENMVTSAGRLPVLGIIHVAGPIWESYLNISEEECARDLHKAIYGSLKTAEKHKYRKVGMPVISSEPFFGVPKDLLADVYVKALVDYSMGMGPLYPVLEIHLVDTDIEMLTYIKDAYEKWATAYNMVEMTQHIKTDLSNQKELSERSQSAVTLKEFPSHRSENMVTFTEQSYTAEGNQKWTFDVLKKLNVHVYTGSIVRIGEVEAIVCGVNNNLKGSIASQVLNVGGKPYDAALKRARGDRDLIEGDVLVSEAGNLATDLVMHSIVTQPIHVINEKNLVRLDRIYTQVLQAANKLGLESLAMPLIGTGRLREKFEVEQCSLQLIDNVIELCLSQGKSLSLRELHLVNVNTVMTQSLTQALRTRAHTKLRIEADPHPPSRQEVLSLPDHMMQTPDLQRSLLSARKPTETDLAEEFKHLADMQRHDKKRKKTFKTIEDMNKAIMGKALLREKTTTVEDKLTESVTIANYNQMDGQNETMKSEADKIEGGKTETNAQTGNYLSKENLQEHTRMLSNVVVKDSSNGKETEVAKELGKPIKLDEPLKQTPEKKEKLNHTLTPKEIPRDEKSPNPKRYRKKKRLPPLTGLVPISSRAESYRSIYIRRQQLAAQVVKEQQTIIRRSHSASHLHHTGVPGDVHNKTARKRRTKPVKGGDDDENMEREKFKKDTQNYFTRGTNDRYKSKTTEFRADMPNTSKIDRQEKYNLTDFLPNNKGYFTERMGMDKTMTRKHVKERVLWDKEREDMYMKEMDMFALATNEALQGRESRFDGMVDRDIPDTYHTHERKQQNVKKTTIKEVDNQPRVGYDGDAFEKEPNKALQHPSKLIKKNISDQKNKSSVGQPITKNTSSASSQGTAAKQQGPVINTMPQEDEQENKIMTLHMTKTDPSAKEIPVNDTIHAHSSSNNVQPFNQKVYPEKPYRESSGNNGINSTDKNHIIEKDYEHAKQFKLENMHGENLESISGGKRSVATNSVKSKPIKLIISSEIMPNNYNGVEIQRENAHTPGDKTPSDKSGELNNSSWIGPQNTRGKTGAITSRSNAAQSVTQRADDVVIRDKLTVEIDVDDTATRESSNVTREKAKIKRFWEVVGGKDVDNEEDIYGDTDHVDSEKVLVTRVTKERKMSARSKASKQTDCTNVASQKLGKYNVTVEVV